MEALLRPHQVLEPDIDAEHAGEVPALVADGRRNGDTERAGALGRVDV